MQNSKRPKQISVSTQTNKEHGTQCFLTEMNTWSWCLVIESDCWSLQYGLVQKVVMIKNNAQFRADAPYAAG